MKAEIFYNPRVFDQLQEQWLALLPQANNPSVFLSPGWFRSWWQAFGQKKQLLVFTFWQDEQLVGIAPFHQINGELAFLASDEVTDYGDLVIKRGYEEKVLSSFLLHLKSSLPGIRKVSFIHVPGSSPLIKTLPRLISKVTLKHKDNLQEKGKVKRKVEVKIEPGPLVLKLALPADYESYLHQLKPKVRHELRRKRRRLVKQGDFQLKEITCFKRKSPLLDNFIKWHVQRDPGKCTFWSQPGMRMFFSLLLWEMSSQGWLRILDLSYQQVDIAFLLQFDFQDRLYLYNIAFDPHFAPYSPGIVLFTEAVRRAIDLGKKEVDFLRGEEKFKLEFGVSPHRVYNVSLILGET